MNDTPSCPLGFICDNGRFERCADIQAKARLQFHFGDVYGGIYCPEGSFGIENCPVGFYCPAPDVKIPCPSGKFCPHKTSVPLVKCSACSEESLKLERSRFGYIIMGYLVLMVLLVIVLLRGKHRDQSKQHLMALQERRLRRSKNQRIQSTKEEAGFLERRLRRISEESEKRLSLKSSTRSSGSSVSLKRPGLKSTSEQGLDASILNEPTESNVRLERGCSSNHSTTSVISNHFLEKLFDDLDLDGNGLLDMYSELAPVLELNEAQLYEFISRMNEMAGLPKSNREVSRTIFLLYFIKVLRESMYFGAADNETEQLYDKMVANSSEANVNGLMEDDFYRELSAFLSDAQINSLLKKFKNLAREDASEEAPAPPSLNRVKTIAPQELARKISRFVERENAIETPAAPPSHRLSRGLRPLSRVKNAAPREFARKMSRFNKERPESFRVKREAFIQHYPFFLREIELEAQVEGSRGIDIAFQDLSLLVKVGGKSVDVIDCVTGRIQARTMTALLGASGAGKTSLLNALCGRAFYGDVSGRIKVNGHDSSIEDHRSSVGFVTQDDIVHAELTVKENFFYSGRFLLPAGTPMEEIEERVDETVANLGLKRVENSIVGDLTHRGISGGERKRVNIGVELMGRPQILFLDEPTSGLDASSALLTMKSLKTLVDRQGVTVCSVIHQPRKFIFDLFDSLVLLGVGGRVIYHGNTRGAQAYFESLNYALPAGESLADWLIDISSGRLEPQELKRDCKASPRMFFKCRKACRNLPPRSLGTMQDSVRRLSRPPDENAVRRDGPSANVFGDVLEKAKGRRENLFISWSDHFARLTEDEKKCYEAPDPYSLPGEVQSPSCWVQFLFQLKRNLLFARRNLSMKVVETLLILCGATVVALLEGRVEVTFGDVPDVSFDTLTSDDPATHAAAFPSLFSFALLPSDAIQQYGTKCGLISSILVGLVATKDFSGKRLEFFREAGSGFNINAYFLAVNVTSTIEHSIQIFLAGGIAFWIRGSMGPWGVNFVNFLLVGWLAVSWAYIFSILLPPSVVVVSTGFFLSIFGIAKVSYESMYENEFTQLLLGFMSSTRYFVETIAVTEHRCLPAQSGFTLTDSATSFPLDMNSFAILGLAQNDFDNVIQRSCDGWYGDFLPPVFVGLTLRWLAAGLLHVAGRSKQAKRSLRQELASREGVEFRHFFLGVAGYLAVLVLLFALASWLILREP